MRGILPLLAMALAALASPASAADDGPLMIARQGSFFVGGREKTSDALSTVPAYAPSGAITIEQMYVHYQIPAATKRASLTLIHGCCLTGKTWETTPDGRMGWDEYFLRRGHAVYVIDQVSRGRSAADPTAINEVRLGKTPANQAPQVFAAGKEAAWTIFRFGPEYPKQYPGSQFPAEGLGELWKQMVPDWIATLPTPNPTVQRLSELAMQLKGTILVGHSQAGVYPFQTAALNTQGIAGIISIEGNCPAAEEDLARYARIPVLVLYGDHVDESPRWAPRLKQCRAFITALQAKGYNARLMILPEMGIKGNSHMLMHDRNSLEIAKLLDDWIAEKVER